MTITGIHVETAEQEIELCDSPPAVVVVGTAGSFVEDLLVRLKVQDSVQCFLPQTVRAVLEPTEKNKQKQTGLCKA